MSVKICSLFFLLYFIALASGPAKAAEEMLSQKSDHFIIRYPDAADSEWAGQVLVAAENYYDSIAREIGYARYRHYWTWDERVEIMIYPDQATFTKVTGQPAWSRGGAVKTGGHTPTRSIHTFWQEAGFLEGLLPHEISHLILYDFVGDLTRVPVWFAEGVAQLQESKNRWQADVIMRILAKKNETIPLAALHTMDIRHEKDPTMVAKFYAQSVSIVDFLIKNYGSSRFGEFCRLIENGEDFMEAMRKTYTISINSLDDLQEKWLNEMSSH